LLIHHLQLNYRYTKKKTTFSDPVKRHHRIRKFMIEIDRALKMQDATWTEGGDFQVRGDYVLVLSLTMLRTWAGRTMLLLSLSDNAHCASFVNSSALSKTPRIGGWV
jgi:arginine deiminase